MTNPDHRYAVLVVDDDRSFCTLMREFLAESYVVATASSGFEALELLQNARFDLILSDVNMPGMTGPELLVEVRSRAPATKTVLITSHNIDDYLSLAKRHSFTTIMPKNVPFNFNELDAVLRGVLTGDAFGIRKYLLSGATTLNRYCIRSSTEAREVRETIVEEFVRAVGTAGDMKLLLDEAVTNAVYHAPRTASGRQRYQELTEVQLEPNEYVYVESAVDDEKYGVSVVDTQGKLRKETVLEKIERHLSGEGILDGSGRGIHMSRLFSDLMVINIRRDVKTEVILINYIFGDHQGFKPLYINEL